MRAALERRGFDVVVVDNDAIYGDPSDDVLDAAFFNDLMRRLAWARVGVRSRGVE